MRSLAFLCAFLHAVTLLSGADRPGGGRPATGPEPRAVTTPTSGHAASAVEEAQALAAELRSQVPPESPPARAWLRMRDGRGKWSEREVEIEIVHGGSNEWKNIYRVLSGPGSLERLTIIHRPGKTNQYLLEAGDERGGESGGTPVSGDHLMKAFAGSDFWLVDLGLDFFFWPEQRMVTDVKRNMRMGRACRMLESVNPWPAAGGYARVVSWIDGEYHGLLCAEAYDADRRLLKTFSVKKLDKVNDEWQLKEMEIRNEKANSRTRLEFGD